MLISRAPCLVALLWTLATPADGHGQRAGADSAARAARLADSLERLDTAADRQRARDLRSAVVQIYRAVGDRSRQAEAMIALGTVLRDLSELDSALTVFNGALDLATSRGDRALQGTALYLSGTTLRYLGRTDSAFGRQRRALALRQQMGDSAGQHYSLVEIATAFFGRGQLDSALRYSTESFRVSRGVPPSEIAPSLAMHGLIHHQLGRLDSARVHYRRALGLARASGNTWAESRTLNNLAGTFGDVGEVDSSLHYFRAALAIRERIGDRHGAATTLDNIGLGLATVGLIDSALVYHRQALALARQVGDPRVEGYILPSLANAFASLGQHDSAIAYNLAAIGMMRSSGNRLYEASALNNVGNLFLRQGDMTTAAAYQDSALTLARLVRSPQWEARALDDLGAIQLALGRTDSALSLYRAALAGSRGIRDRLLESRILTNIATTLHRRRPGHLSQGLRYYDSAAAVRSVVVRRAGPDQNRVGLLERYAGLFAQWTLAWLAREREIGNEAVLGGLGASERGRSQGLLNLMRRAAPSDSIGDLAAEGRRLVAGLRGTPALIYQATGDTLLIWSVGTDGSVVLAREPIGHEALASLVSEVRAGLGAGGSSRLGARSLAAGDPPTRPAARTPRWAAATTELAGLVFPAQVRNRIAGAKDLVVVPHGSLTMIPFSALPAAPGQPIGIRTSIRYAPSLTALLAAEGRPASGERRDRNALVVGNPTMPTVTAASGTRESLSRLPGAEAEARSIAGYLGAVLLNGEAASEGRVRRGLNDARVVHLATHGFAYQGEAGARRSFVALAPDAGQDGLFTVGELLDDPAINLNADLVVLSACQTGLGDLKLAEGTLGLQRAFLAKGARSVLVSLWNVSDEATRALMEAFYRHWLDDPDHPGKGEALRRAQADVRGKAGWEHPRYWAGFQLVGAD